MSKKELNEQNIVNELTGNSAFFPSSRHNPVSPTPDKDLPAASEPESAGDESERKTSLPPVRPQAAKGYRGEEKNEEEGSDTTVSAKRDTTIPPYPETTIEAIRKAVKQLGKEAATYRFTVEEKKLLRDVVYTYLTQGVRTSENEITRIAIHFLIADYHENNRTSMLARVLERLND